MKAVVHVNHLAHQQEHGQAVKQGLERHGFTVDYHPAGSAVSCAVSVVWGLRNAQPYLEPRDEATWRPVLVMERGYIGDRFAWTAIGWNGLNGRAYFPIVDDGGHRLDKHFPDAVQPYTDISGHALIVGQVEGDASLIGVDINSWYQQIADRLMDIYEDVRFRPHPVAVQRGMPSGCPNGVALDPNVRLADAIAGADIVCGFNSNALTDAMLAGVPALAADNGAMIWPVQDIAEREAGARERWAGRLAWCQWTLEEIAAGDFWDVIKDPVHQRWCDTDMSGSEQPWGKTARL